MLSDWQHGECISSWDPRLRADGMGCGGSRADTIEPRYYESWTRETESTWLTNTDTEAPLPGIANGCSSIASEPSALEKDTLETGIQIQTHVTVSANVHEKVSTDKKTLNVGTNTQIGKHHLTQVPPTMKQKRRLFRTEEKKWDSNKMPAKEVNIHVTKSVCSVESDEGKMENCMK
ncbi:brain and acute leukemia cytoplasmic protein-like isoform X2 [Stegostoma tigrinum]|uniref:brain and acute leukemia cytoplasmic protein-like isoform X2 n=1 Tax=Stegostoma tigrinum TaxID=3053191 RepID=UPI00286FE825|nr:brain and acute leukemia cytoplasmic protein-like isoform X2 [Stegostoma tigrinum]